MGMFGVDRYYYPITITSSNNEIPLEEGATPDTATALVGAGTYWNHDDATLTAAGYPSLIDAVRSAIDAASPGGLEYLIDAGTPAGSSLASSGLAFEGEATFRIGGPSSTFDMRLLGASGESDWLPDPGDFVFTTPASTLGTWQTFTNFADNAANSKLRDPHDLREASTDDDPLNSFEYLWKSFTDRDIEYPWVPALHIWEDADERGAVSAYQESAGLPAGDANNTLEALWRAAKKKDDIIVVHDEGDQDLQVTTHPYEIVVLRDKQQRTRFRDLFTMRRRTGEFYDVELKWAIRESTYTY